jgi:hypothetical protein
MIKKAFRAATLTTLILFLLYVPFVIAMWEHPIRILRNVLFQQKARGNISSHDSELLCYVCPNPYIRSTGIIPVCI